MPFGELCDLIAIEQIKNEGAKRKKTQTEEKIASIKAFGEREYSEIHRDMIEEARKELFSILKENGVEP